MAETEVKAINNLNICDTTARAAIANLNSAKLSAKPTTSTSGLREVVKDANGKLWISKSANSNTR